MFSLPIGIYVFESFYWSMDLSRIEWAASFYELWSKAGATPAYKSKTQQSI